MECKVSCSQQHLEIDDCGIHVSIKCEHTGTYQYVLTAIHRNNMLQWTKQCTTVLNQNVVQNISEHLYKYKIYLLYSYITTGQKYQYAVNCGPTKKQTGNELYKTTTINLALATVLLKYGYFKEVVLNIVDP